MQRRVLGLETEYGMVFWPRGPRQVRGHDLRTRIARSPLGRPAIANGFLPNGARFYIDTGDHPEYATPECDSAYDLVAHDKAGERLMADLSVATEEMFRAEGRPGRVYFFKNNTDSANHTFGCHENYLVERAHTLPELAEYLAPFFATRQLLVGAGKLRMEEGRPVYAFSQRAAHIVKTLSGGTTQQRGMISDRDESHADRNRYRRLHVLVGDANMSETTTLLKMVSTSLVLGMFEDGIAVRGVALEDPALALRTAADDISGRARIRTASGGTTTALDVQRRYHAAASRYAEARGLTGDPAVATALELWGRTLDALSSDDRSRIEREVDWAIKLGMLDRYCAQHGIDLASPRAAQLDLLYHDVRPDRGLFSLLDRRGEVARVVPEQAIASARDTPPPTTRAHLRGSFVREVIDAQASSMVTMNWSVFGVRLPGKPTRYAACGDPFATEDHAVDALCEALRTHRAQTPAPIAVPPRPRSRSVAALPTPSASDR